MKKIVSVVLAVATIFCLVVPCSASTISAPDWSGFNVSTVNPFDSLNQASPYGTSAPTTSYNLHTNRQYSFYGKASWSMLWLSKYLYGCTKYGVYINNKSSSNLTITARGVSGGDITKVIPANTDTTDKPLYFTTPSTDTLFCITFDAPSDFEGWVFCAD